MLPSIRPLGLLLFSLLLCSEAWAGDAVSQPPIVIGIIVPLTGDMAAVGAACRDAAQMALADTSQSVKRKYQLKFEDDRLTPNEVAKAAHKLLSIDKVSALVSTWSYGGSIVSPLAERAKVPHIGVAWDRRIADGQFNFLHLTPPGEFMKAFLSAFQGFGAKRIALLGMQESGSEFALEEFARLAPHYNVEVVFRDTVPFNTNDFRSLLARIRQSKPDYLLYNLGGDAMILKMLADIKTQQVTIPHTAITSFDIVSDPSLIEGKWYVSDSYLPDDFAERFKKAYGHEIRYGIGNFYEAVRLLINAFEHSERGQASEAVIELQKVKTEPGLFGPTSVDTDGVFSYPAQYMRVRNGKREATTMQEIAMPSHQ